MIDYASLSEELASSDGGPTQTVGDRLQAKRMEDLLTAVLRTLANPKKVEIPSITVPQAPAAQIVVTPAAEQKACSWEFSFVRNEDKTLNKIIAKAITE